jgi:peroxiredoxin Q/BCP
MSISMRGWGVGLAGLILSASSLFGQQPAEPPRVGDLAPDFDLPGSDGRRHKLSEYRDRNQAVVVAWFPKAFTGG